MKKTWFLVVRHAEVDKKHPDGEAAPLTKEELNAKPEFCTGLTALINDDGSLNILCRNYEPFPTSED